MNTISIEILFLIFFYDEMNFGLVEINRGKCLVM